MRRLRSHHLYTVSRTSANLQHITADALCRLVICQQRALKNKVIRCITRHSFGCCYSAHSYCVTHLTPDSLITTSPRFIKIPNERLKSFLLIFVAAVISDGALSSFSGRKSPLDLIISRRVSAEFCTSA